MRRSRKPVWAVSSIEGSNPSLSVRALANRGTCRCLPVCEPDRGRPLAAAQGRSRPLDTGVFFPQFPTRLDLGLTRSLVGLRQIGIEQDGGLLLAAGQPVAISVDGDRNRYVPHERLERFGVNGRVEDAIRSSTPPATSPSPTAGPRSRCAATRQRQAHLFLIPCGYAGPSNQRLPSRGIRARVGPRACRLVANTISSKQSWPPVLLAPTSDSRRASCPRSTSTSKWLGAGRPAARCFARPRRSARGTSWGRSAQRGSRARTALHARGCRCLRSCPGR
jgi:hypothetical protein